MRQKIGVLALQGAFAEHILILNKAGADAVAVRQKEELAGLDGLVIPGGESTTITKLMRRYGLFDPIREMAGTGKPVMGTCAGMIMLAQKVNNDRLPTLELMDISVRRNAFGRQVDSFEADISVPCLGAPDFHAIFIRAPLVESTGSNVAILAKLNNGTIVAVRQNNLLALAFHPELGKDIRFHEYFLKMA